MPPRRLHTSLVALALLAASTVTTEQAAHAKGAKRGDWIRLAKVRLSLLERRETLDVTTDRAVRKIRLHVEKVGVVFGDASVRFDDGRAQDVTHFTGFVAAGERTRAVEIEGGTRVIDEVVIAAETRPSAIGTAEIELWGLP